MLKERRGGKPGTTRGGLMEVEAFELSLRIEFIRQTRGMGQRIENHPGTQNSLVHFTVREQQVVQNAREKASLKRSRHKLSCIS